VGQTVEWDAADVVEAATDVPAAGPIGRDRPNGAAAHVTRSLRHFTFARDGRSITPEVRFESGFTLHSVSAWPSEAVPLGRVAHRLIDEPPAVVDAVLAFRLIGLAGVPSSTPLVCCVFAEDTWTDAPAVISRGVSDDNSRGSVAADDSRVV
jgi:hypothetical protein